MGKSLLSMKETVSFAMEELMVGSSLEILLMKMMKMMKMSHFALLLSP